MSRRVLGVNEVLITVIRIQSHPASTERNLKVKWLKSNRKTRGAGEDLWEVSWRDGAISRRLNFTIRS